MRPGVMARNQGLRLTGVFWDGLSTTSKWKNPVRSPEKPELFSVWEAISKNEERQACNEELRRVRMSTVSIDISAIWSAQAVRPRPDEPEWMEREVSRCGCE